MYIHAMLSMCCLILKLSVSFLAELGQGRRACELVVCQFTLRVALAMVPKGGNWHIGLISTQSLDQAVLIGFQPLHTWTGVHQCLAASTATAAAATAMPAPSNATTPAVHHAAAVKDDDEEDHDEEDDEEDFNRQCELAFLLGKGRAKGWDKSACKDLGFSKGTCKGRDTTMKVKKTSQVVSGSGDRDDGYAGSGSGSGSLITG